MGYTEAVYYMLDGGLDKYVIEQLEVTDTWKHDFIAPGYASQSTELCVGWDEVTVEVPTTPSITINKNDTWYNPVSPSKGYKSVTVNIPTSATYTFNENGDWTFGVDTSFGTEAFKSLTAAVPIKTSERKTENHTTWTYPDGSGNIGVKEVIVDVYIYPQEEIDRINREAKALEDQCTITPVPPPPTENWNPYPVDDIPIREIVPIFPDSEMVTGRVSFQIVTKYAKPTLQSQAPYAVELYSGGTRQPPVYWDMGIFVRWFVDGQPHHDDVVVSRNAQSEIQHSMNYLNHAYQRVEGVSTIYNPGLELRDATFTVLPGGMSGQLDLSIYINDWQYGWGIWTWSGQESTYGIYNDPVEYPTGKPEADCIHPYDETFTGSYYIHGVTEIRWEA